MDIISRKISFRHNLRYLIREVQTTATGRYFFDPKAKRAVRQSALFKTLSGKELLVKAI
jgi:hypothetical protein